MEKKYAYEEIIALTEAGGRLDNALTILQNKINDLESAFVTLQDDFHGIGSGSTIYKAYDAVFQYDIGKKDFNGSYWWTVDKIGILANTIYDNAVADQKSDEQM